MEDLKFKEILVRKPYFMVLPKKRTSMYEVLSGQNVSEPNDPLSLRIVTQSDFIREYYPSSHKINNRILFPDVFKKDPDTNEWSIQPISRCAFAMQQYIEINQTVSLVGNEIQFELASKSDNDAIEIENTNTLRMFKEGWLIKNMEVRFYEAVHSIKIVGDAAVVGYFDSDHKFNTLTMSFLNGDKLYPHFDTITGKLNLFARKYNDIDEEGNITTEFVEVWDEKYLYRCKRGISNIGALQYIKDFFGLGGFTIISKEEHGFNFVPVAYFRSKEGACWSPAQDTIEKYEEAFSYFYENNKAFAFPIFYTKGEDVSIIGDLNGAAKAIDMPKEAEAGFIERQDSSNSYMSELNTLYKLIHIQSFTVEPPELKSGDLSGVAIKLLFSPAIDKAIHDAHQMQDFLEQIVYMVKYGYGYETNMQATMINLKINSWIEPYMHQNDSELMQNLAIGVQNGFLSHETASERASKYAKNDEIDRIIREKKEEQQMDLLNQLKETKTNPNTI